MPAVSSSPMSECRRDISLIHPLLTRISLTRPQLIAVSASSNRGKGDQDPAEWLPEREAYHCTYVRAWVQVKYYYDLSVDSLEKAALSDILSGC